MSSGFLFAFLTLVAFSGCNVNLDTEDYPKTEPRLKDIAGVYLPTADTLLDIQNRGHYPATNIVITLAPDGTFTGQNIPDWWMAEFGKSSGGFITKAGMWKPVKHQEWWCVGLDLSAPKQFTAEITSINLVGAKPPFALCIVLGDPDEGKGMIFTKQE